MIRITKWIDRIAIILIAGFAVYLAYHLMAWAVRSIDPVWMAFIAGGVVVAAVMVWVVAMMILAKRGDRKLFRNLEGK